LAGSRFANAETSSFAPPLAVFPVHVRISVYVLIRSIGAPQHGNKRKKKVTEERT